MARPTARTIAAASGVAAVVVAFVSILGAVALAPWFSWQANALSHLGAPDRASAPLFNGGLILAGVLGLGLFPAVWRTATHPVQRVGAAILVLAVGAMALVGAFPVGHSLHGPVSVTFFVAFTYGLFAFGTGDALAGHPRRGVATIWLGIAHVTGWAFWLAADIEGVAIPEFVGATTLGVWVLATARRFHSKRYA
jgi:hypothetical membrane protein